MAKSKSSSSRRWLKEHFSDPYVKLAQQAGYRSRAVFKIFELQEKDKLFHPGMIVIDLGAAPGGWSQVVKQWVAPKGQIIALDILPMEPLEGVEFILGDFMEQSVLDDLLVRVEDKRIDWVISDMAPNLSGIDSVDQPRSLELAELALDFALRVLGNRGGFLVKVFQGSGFDEFLVQIKQNFKKVTIRKPKASRGRSREVYVLARN
jgi:23S rRNA (uridine2552-2'-O)-methyltransferase